MVAISISPPSLFQRSKVTPRPLASAPRAFNCRFGMRFPCLTACGSLTHARRFSTVFGTTPEPSVALLYQMREVGTRINPAAAVPLTVSAVYAV